MVADGVERARERGGRRGCPMRAVATTPAPALRLDGGPRRKYGAWLSVSASAGAHGCPAPASQERDPVAGGAGARTGVTGRLKSLDEKREIKVKGGNSR